MEELELEGSGVAPECGVRTEADRPPGVVVDVPERRGDGVDRRDPGTPGQAPCVPLDHVVEALRVDRCLRRIRERDGLARVGGPITPG